MVGSIEHPECRQLAPTLERPSRGRFVQRVPRSLHAQLIAQAKIEGVSLNALVVSIVSQGLGQRQAESSDADRLTKRSTGRKVREPRRRLPMADSVILGAARSYAAVLWTQDADFKGIPGVEYRKQRSSGETG
jgi:hypothetical protein